MGLKPRRSHRLKKVVVRLRNLPDWPGLYCRDCNVVYAGRALDKTMEPHCPDGEETFKHQETA